MNNSSYACLRAKKYLVKCFFRLGFHTVFPFISRKNWTALDVKEDSKRLESAIELLFLVLNYLLKSF